MRDFQSPCLGTLFASLFPRSSSEEREGLSIPMFGDSFCKVRLESPSLRTLFYAFNPHVWGLFLQAVILRHVPLNSSTILSIPMFGDSFCKFLKISVAVVATVFVTFQSPCLGTLFASEEAQHLPANTFILSIPMFGDSFCKVIASSSSQATTLSFQSPCLGTLFASRGG